MIDWTRLTPAVERAAGIAASNFPAHHDISDVKQELWVWIMSNKNSVTRTLKGTDDAEGAVVRHLVKVAQTYLKKEDAASYNYPEGDQFFYSLNMIKSILEVVFDHEDWQSFASALDAMPKGQSDPATAGDNLASYADISRALTHLPEDQYNLLVWRYKYHYTFEQIGHEVDISRQAARERLETAVRGIQRLLGQRELSQLRSGYDARTQDALTRGRIGRSETAQHVVERDYEG